MGLDGGGGVSGVGNVQVKLSQCEGIHDGEGYMEITGPRCISWLLTMFQRNVRIGNILRKREHCLQSSGCSFRCTQFSKTDQDVYRPTSWCSCGGEVRIRKRACKSLSNAYPRPLLSRTQTNETTYSAASSTPFPLVSQDSIRRFFISSTKGK